LLLASYNVNGIRAAMKHGLAAWIAEVAPDILCLQEIRIGAPQLSTALVPPLGYYCYWHHGERAGYSGTAILSRSKPLSVRCGLGPHVADHEGRAMVAEYPGFTLINCYCPSGASSPARFAFKLAFYDTVLDACLLLLQEGKRVILCGDVNAAHQRLDLANPSATARTLGFTPAERRWMDGLTHAGFIDTFRHFHPSLPGQYTWWPAGRERAAGWRLDYVFASSGLVERVADAFILQEVRYSDHCPVGISLLPDETQSSGCSQQQVTEPPSMWRSMEAG